MRNITLDLDAYERLARNKLENESFSDAIKRNFSEKRDIMSCFGTWSDETAEGVKKEIENMRKRARERAKKRDEQFFN